MRETLECNQSWIYLIAVMLGLLLGLQLPSVSSSLESLLWPLIAVLLYVTFCQIPLTTIRPSLSDWRFNSALLLGNFVIIPLTVGIVVTLLPIDRAVQVGILLVLLVPCTDWFITFTHLGKGDGRRAVLASPLLLFMQLLLLPFYLWLWLGSEGIRESISVALLDAFLWLILTPLLLAWLTQVMGRRGKASRQLIRGLSALPVPLLALVLCLVAASQVTLLHELATQLLPVILAFVAYLILALWLGILLGGRFALPAIATRTLVFSFSTRNSFVMLPIAMALPTALQPAVIVIVLQSLVELFAMILFVKYLPDIVPED